MNPGENSRSVPRVLISLYVSHEGMEPLYIQPAHCHVDLIEHKVKLPAEHDRAISLPFRDTLYKHLEKLLKAVDEFKQNGNTSSSNNNTPSSDLSSPMSVGIEELHRQGHSASNLVQSNITNRAKNCMRFNVPVREIFFSMFTHVFHSYESYGRECLSL